MRRRGCEGTGIGNPSAEVMDGASTGSPDRDQLISECARDCFRTFFEGTKLDYGVCDAGLRLGELILGLEPSYFGDPIKLIVLSPSKVSSRLQTGIAKGWYGSGWRTTTKWYRDYKYESKFVRFVDKWQPLLFPEVAKGGDV